MDASGLIYALQGVTLGILASLTAALKKKVTDADSQEQLARIAEAQAVGAQILSHLTNPPTPPAA